jgi:hypothetical protein
MKNHAGLNVIGAIALLVACGGASETDFGDPLGGHSKAGSGAGEGSGGTSTGGSTNGGTSGSSTGGTGAVATGGSADGGTAGDVMAVGGTAGDLMAAGGSAGDATATGGSAGDLMAAGGSAGDAMATGGTDPGAGGSGNATGGTGMGTGGTAGSAGKPGTGGTAGMPNCEELAQQYAETLQAAQACNAGSGKDQCTKLVPGSLSCGCDVFVDPDNTEAIAELARLRKLGLECSMTCPAIACVAPMQGRCMQTLDGARGEGHCTMGPPTPL